MATCIFLFRFINFINVLKTRCKHYSIKCTFTCRGMLQYHKRYALVAILIYIGIPDYSGGKFREISNDL